VPSRRSVSSPAAFSTLRCWLTAGYLVPIRVREDSEPAEAAGQICRRHQPLATKLFHAVQVPGEVVHAQIERVELAAGPPQWSGPADNLKFTFERSLWLVAPKGRARPAGTDRRVDCRVDWRGAARALTPSDSARAVHPQRCHSTVGHSLSTHY
jgi:hypothetical protein